MMMLLHKILDRPILLCTLIQKVAVGETINDATNKILRES